MSARRLRSLDVVRLVRTHDAVDALERDLIDRPQTVSQSVSIGRHRVVVRDPATRTSCTMPVRSLRATAPAVVGALAARTLLLPGVATVAVVGGSRRELDEHLRAVARTLPEIGHVMIWPTATTASGWDAPLRARGVGSAAASGVTDAVFGASLVVVAGPAPDLLARHILRGAVVVNASGGPLPPGLYQAAGRAAFTELPPGRAPCPPVGRSTWVPSCGANRSAGRTRTTSSSSSSTGRRRSAVSPATSAGSPTPPTSAPCAATAPRPGACGGGHGRA